MAALLVACTASSSSSPDAAAPPDAQSMPAANPEALQMNDISVLFPLAKTQADFDTYLMASSAGSGGALLPESLYESDPQGSFLTYANMYVVGFRLDPCFGHVGPITDPSGCDNQLRLVFEQMGFSNGSAGADDAAVHVSYSITRDQLLAIANALVAARVQATSDDLGPLAPSPLMARQGLQGAYAATVRELIATYAGGANIERITQLTFDLSGGVTGSDFANGNNVFFWEMHGSTVANGVETSLPIATAGSGAITDGVQAATDPALDAVLQPITQGSDNLALLASTSHAMAATSAQRQAAFDAALRIENPSFNSPDTIDCASCHMAEPARELVGQSMFGLSATGDANGFVADASIPTGDLAETTTSFVNPALNALD
ncbi:MAG TPA: hypothetical protein VGG28_32060, partial [Kofleriaceae bacterium]